MPELDNHICANPNSRCWAETCPLWSHRSLHWFCRFTASGTKLKIKLWCKLNQELLLTSRKSGPRAKILMDLFLYHSLIFTDIPEISPHWNESNVHNPCFIGWSFNLHTLQKLLVTIHFIVFTTKKMCVLLRKYKRVTFTGSEVLALLVFVRWGFPHPHWVRALRWSWGGFCFPLCGEVGSGGCPAGWPRTGRRRRFCVLAPLLLHLLLLPLLHRGQVLLQQAAVCAVHAGACRAQRSHRLQRVRRATAQEAVLLRRLLVDGRLEARVWEGHPCAGGVWAFGSNGGSCTAECRRCNLRSGWFNGC